MNDKNLLEAWYSQAFEISSPFNIMPLIDRAKVDFIYQTLVRFFGLKFFNANPHHDQAIDKISWLFSLLSNNKHLSCYHALYDICRLIEYAETLDESIQNDLSNLKKNPENLRSFFFELFIYRLLDNNNIPNTKKPVSDRQVLEGLCEILGAQYLFECRKVFLPKINELDVMRRLMMDIYKQTKKMKVGLGLIMTINLKRPVAGAHKKSFEQKIAAFFEGLNNLNGPITMKYSLEDTFGLFNVIDYDEASLVEIQNKKNFDILYYIIPPKIPVPNVPNYYHSKVVCNFSILESKIYRKFEAILKEKKNQHRRSPIKNKIIFIDSEMLPEFHMNLFQNENMFHSEQAKRIYDKLHLKDIVCVIRRNYTDKGIRVMVDTFCPQVLQPVADYVKSLFGNCFSQQPLRSHLL